MEFEKVMALRQSVRAYTKEDVTDEDTAALLAAAQASPVGMHNYKGYMLGVVHSPEVLAKMKAAFTEKTGQKNDPLYGAPLFIFVADGPDALPEVAPFDGACIVNDMHLAATARGLGSVFILGMMRTLRDDASLAAALGLPEGYRLLCGLAAGHAAHPVKERKEETHFPVLHVR